MAVALRVEHPPELSDLAADPPQVSAAPCSTQPTTTLAGAAVTDESPLASVTLRWGRQLVPMSQRSGRWFAQLGPAAAGTVSWQVVATDDRGNSASASGPPVQVLACR